MNKPVPKSPAKPEKKLPELDPKTRKLLADAQIAESKLRVIQGTLVDKTDRDNAEIARIQAARQLLLTIPPKCATLGLDKGMVKAITNIVNQALNELAAEVSGLS